MDIWKAESELAVHIGLSNPSLCNPPVLTAPVINVFWDLILMKSYPPKILHSFFGLVIHPMDKGGGYDVLDKADYQKEMCRILSDHGTYSELSNNPTSMYKRISSTNVWLTDFKYKRESFYFRSRPARSRASPDFIT